VDTVFVFVNANKKTPVGLSFGQLALYSRRSFCMMILCSLVSISTSALHFGHRICACPFTSISRLLHAGHLTCSRIGKARLLFLVNGLGNGGALFAASSSEGRRRMFGVLGAHRSTPFVNLFSRRSV